MAKRSSCKYTAPYGSRSIYRDGKPFISITREGVDTPHAPRPVDVDDFARKILRMLCKR